MRVDAIHRQNRQAFLDKEAIMANNDEKVAANLAGSGLNLLQNAILGVKWGKEEREKQ